MSPSKNSNFSPYKAFLRGRARRTSVVNKNVDISKILENTKSSLPNKKDNNEFKRNGRKRRTVQYESNIINLKDIQDDEEKKNKIKEGIVKDLTRKRKQNNDLSEEQIQIKPAFKKRIKKKDEKSYSKPKNKKKKKKKKKI